jgi:hypothetical protein
MIRLVVSLVQYECDVRKGRFNGENAHKVAYRQIRRLAWDPAWRLHVAVVPTEPATVVAVVRVLAAAVAVAVEARCCPTQGLQGVLAQVD